MKPEDGSSRGVNRHRYSMQEADEALEQPVVQALLRLCQFRNTHPAFNGDVRPASPSLAAGLLDACACSPQACLSCCRCCWRP